MISTVQVTGRWKNSKSSTVGIAEFTLAEVDNKLSISFQGATGGSIPGNIGPIEAVAHASDDSSSDCIAFQAETTVDGKQYIFAGNINKGLVIIATYIRILNGEKPNFFIREFFYKLK